jgi:hypothetical protein
VLSVYFKVQLWRASVTLTHLPRRLPESVQGCHTVRLVGGTREWVGRGQWDIVVAAWVLDDAARDLALYWR